MPKETSTTDHPEKRSRSSECECGHERGDHDKEGCSLGHALGCDCRRDSHGHLPVDRPARAKGAANTLLDRLDALANAGRPNGPRLAEIAAEVTDLLEHLQIATDQAGELAGAAELYDNAEPGREGVEDRADAWETAQEAATELRGALDEIDQVTA